MLQYDVTTKVLAWFAEHRRDLPWRNNASPWHVLASEIMLQQTQVERVIPKYNEFITRWPTPKDLAETSQQDFLRFWSGLGYNRRALNLHKAATVLATTYNNTVPQELEQLLELPGIGKYTAGAVASFAFNRNVTLWDTNVRRIVLRVFYGGEFAPKLPDNTTFEEKLTELLPQEQSREWHGALMDFGSLVCTGRTPQCVVCPLSKECQASQAFQEGRIPAAALIRPQATFNGSLRQLRGEIIRRITAGSRGIKIATLKQQLSDGRIETAIASLEKEGFLKASRGVIKCA